MLQEMCLSRHWAYPSYEMVNEEGLPHERLFTIACVVLKYRETGKLEVCVALGTLSTVYRRDVC
jgi:dsRNA-specific ribonuclease